LYHFFVFSYLFNIANFINIVKSPKLAHGYPAGCFRRVVYWRSGFFAGLHSAPNGAHSIQAGSRVLRSSPEFRRSAVLAVPAVVPPIGGRQYWRFRRLSRPSAAAGSGEGGRLGRLACPKTRLLSGKGWLVAFPPLPEMPGKSTKKGEPQ